MYFLFELYGNGLKLESVSLLIRLQDKWKDI